jgi:flavin-dependent dehydrogenase
MMTESGRRRALVVGAGPAGAAAAVQLARAGHATMIVERAGGDGWRAGETLPPVAAELLRALGLWERFLADGHRPSRRTASAWGNGRLRFEHHLFNAHGSGWHVDRVRFDEMLVAAAEEAGARRCRGARVASVERSDHHWQVVLSAGGVRTVEECDWLVDATGRGAAIARMLGERWRDDDRTVAIVGLLAAPASGASVEEALLVESAERGWWYSAMLPDGTLLAAYLSDGGDIVGAARDRWHLALASTSHTAARARGFALTGIRVRRASTGCVTRAAGPGWVAVGDAAMAHDPLSGQGLVHALATGMRGAAALRSGGEGTDAYRAEASTRRQAHLRQRAEVYRCETRWPASPYWRRRQAIDRAAPDTIDGAD